MSFLRRVVPVLAITLLTSLGAVELWSIEIDCIKGRPWDSGSVEIYGGTNQRPAYERDLKYRSSHPETETSDCQRGEKSFEEFLNNLFSFLNL